jgi:hypothetical protein
MVAPWQLFCAGSVPLGGAFDKRNLPGDYAAQMIIFVTTKRHAYTVASLVDGRLGPSVPQFRAMAWEHLFHARRIPRATYVFTDLERLSPPELFFAAQVYQAATAVGLRCLNNPALVRHRYALLHALHAHGHNPFTVYRAEISPRPERFPVFIRCEADHGFPVTGLLGSQAELDAALVTLHAQGVPLRFMVVIEFCAAPIAPNVWRKFGTFRVGAGMHLDHAVVEDNWLVKYGTPGLTTAAQFAEERDAVAANEGAETLRPAFEIAQIEYGRADHATVNGQEVVYEINTNPHIGRLSRQRSPVRDEALAIARARFLALLAEIDTQEGGKVVIPTAAPSGWRYRLAPIVHRLREGLSNIKTSVISG